MRAKLVLLIPPALLAVAVVGVPVGQGADPFVAGGRSTRVIAIDRSASDGALARARDVGRALGVTGVRETVARLDDRFDHRVYDEVVSFDSQGHEVGLTRLDTSGKVLLAMRLGWTPGSGRKIDAVVAVERAVSIARTAGLAIDGAGEARHSDGVGGWVVRWPRVVDGVVVRGDGVRVSLLSDGSFRAVTRNESPLAARPAGILAADAAREIAERIVAQRFTTSAGGLGVVAVEQSWLAPNDTWDSSKADAPDATLRLAWVVRLQASGVLAERMRLIEFWLDAGDGTLIGGDIVE